MVCLPEGTRPQGGPLVLLTLPIILGCAQNTPAQAVQLIPDGVHFGENV